MHVIKYYVRQCCAILFVTGAQVKKQVLAQVFSLYVRQQEPTQHQEPAI